jgi:cysteine-rich repeat protein
MNRTRLASALFLVALSVTWAGRASAACGDGALDGGETCDDGNLASGDGCAGICQYEAGFRCTGSPSLCCFADAARGFSLIGSASIDAATSEITLTPAAGLELGYAWFQRPLDFSGDFSLNLKLYLGDSDGGADGGTVLFQRDPRGLAATGLPGGELGAALIEPVVGIEFDTWDNGLEYGDIFDDHTSIFFGAPNGGAGPEGQRTNAACLNDACDDFEDGVYHSFAVTWTAATTTMRVAVDGVERLALSEDLIDNYFAGDPTGIWFGFAASTGGSYNLQKFCPQAPSGFTAPSDEDADGVDDSEDLDDDNDGLADAEETRGILPHDPSADHDTDGIKNWLDPNYWADVVEEPASCADVVAPIGECDRAAPEIDLDGDGAPNHLDEDSDADGLTDAAEAPGTDEDGDGVPDDCGEVDASGVCEGGLVVVPADSDSDTDPDYLDADDDGDDIPTRTECPAAAPCPDSDGDGVPDQLDQDADNDGTPDREDGTPTSPCSPDPSAVACPSGDSDGDGVPNGIECAAGFECADTDGDGVPDPLDDDSDDDGVDDGDDDARLDPTVCRDADGDSCSDCRNTGADRSGGDELDDGEDTDGDGSCNEGDADNDDDGVFDESDAAPNDARACRDTDLDGCDDCSNTGPNESGGDAADDGPDADGDGECDPSDGDDDDDGVLDAADVAPLDPNRCRDLDLDQCDDCTRTGADRSGGDTTDDGADTDGDGRCDAGETDIDGDGVRDPFDADQDNDGVPNAMEGAADTDADGVADAADLDSDADGIPDVVEQGFGDHDADGDGRLDDDDDADGDGLADAVDSAPADANVTTLSVPELNSDGDGQPDRLDSDSDDDGASDHDERYDGDEDGFADVTRLDRDADGDGFDDAFDLDQGGSYPDPPNTDARGPANFIDPDDDGDGLLSRFEDLNENGTPADDHTDGDDHPNFLDADDDGDGRPTAEENADPNADGDPSDALDLDLDGVDDYLDAVVTEPPGAGGAGGGSAGGASGEGATPGDGGIGGDGQAAGGVSGAAGNVAGGEAGTDGGSVGAAGDPSSGASAGGPSGGGGTSSGEAGSRSGAGTGRKRSVAGGGLSCALASTRDEGARRTLGFVVFTIAVSWLRRRRR